VSAFDALDVRGPDARRKQLVAKLMQQGAGSPVVRRPMSPVPVPGGGLAGMSEGRSFRNATDVRRTGALPGNAGLEHRAERPRQARRRRAFACERSQRRSRPDHRRTAPRSHRRTRRRRRSAPSHAARGCHPCARGRSRRRAGTSPTCGTTLPRPLPQTPAPRFPLRFRSAGGCTTTPSPTPCAA
jgi:hypothetical protein